MRGLFVSFEGADGCGKSTQMKLAAEYLRQKGVEPVLTREPGGCPMSESVRTILLDPTNRAMAPETEMLLYAAARAQHVAEVIRPALEEGRVVLSDRYIDSSFAYQGCGRGLGVEAVRNVNAYAMKDIWPDLTLFFDVPAEEGIARMRKRSEHDRLEQSGEQFFQRVRDGFRETARKNPDRVVSIDASGPVEETQKQVRAALDEALAWKGL